MRKTLNTEGDCILRFSICLSSCLVMRIPKNIVWSLEKRPSRHFCMKKAHLKIIFPELSHFHKKLTCRVLPGSQKSPFRHKFPHCISYQQRYAQLFRDERKKLIIPRLMIQVQLEYKAAYPVPIGRLVNKISPNNGPQLYRSRTSILINPKM